MISAVVIGTGIFLLFGLFKKNDVFTQQTTGILRPILKESATSSKPFWETVNNPDIPPLPAAPHGGASVTESFSRELLSSLLFEKPMPDNREIDIKDTQISEGDIENAMNVLFSKTATFETPRMYTTSNTKVIESTPDTLKTYGNIFMATVIKHASANAADTLSAFERAIKTRDENAITALKHISEEYGKMESDLLSIPPPDLVASLHIDFVNNVRSLSQTVTDMAETLRDPLRATTGLSAYLKQLDQAWVILNRIHIIFEAEKVTFAEDESGYGWRGFSE